MSSRRYEPRPEIELAGDDWQDLNGTATTLDVVEGEQQIMNGQVEVRVENPSSNANAQRRGRRRGLRLRLYRAALRGDWKLAEAALTDDQSAASLEITETGERPLHMAAARKQTAFVRNLLGHLNRGDLALRNKNGNTAFSFAAVSGVVEIAKLMYQENNDLPTLRDSNNVTPIEMAAWMGNKKMVEYLSGPEHLQNFEACDLMKILVATISSEMYDIALKILEEHRREVRRTPYADKGNALLSLARKPLSYYGTSQECICESLARIVRYVPCFRKIHSSIEKRRQAVQLVEKLWKQILALRSSEFSKLFSEIPILNDATKIGNVEFLTLLTRSYPDLIRRIDSNNYTIFHLAVIYRQEKVFSLIYQTGAIKDMLMLHRDDSGNNILHLAAKLAPSSRLNSVSGAALQMQRELLWFKEVEKILLPFSVQMKNKDGKTPRELFTKQHEKLREAGERWMNGTATSCMVVATLIATVTFAAAFTVPGGNKEKIGTPTFLNDRWFTIFVMSDTVAMFSSTASIMMFLSILTSRYGEEDFLYTLPAKLMVGLFTLFASIVCMVLTFSATFFLVCKKEKEETLPKIIAGLALLPIILYAVLNFRLWISLIKSAIWESNIMFRPGKHKLF